MNEHVASDLMADLEHMQREMQRLSVSEASAYEAGRTIAGMLAQGVSELEDEPQASVSFQSTRQKLLTVISTLTESGEFVFALFGEINDLRRHIQASWDEPETLLHRLNLYAERLLGLRQRACDTEAIPPATSKPEDELGALW